MDPLTPFAISAATHSVKPIARGVSHLTDFASVLADEVAQGLGAQEKEAVPPTTDQIEALQREANEIINRLLRNSDLAANLPLRINVQPDGELRLGDDHPRGAEIEALLNGDKSLRRLTEQMNSDKNTAVQLVFPPDANLTETGLASYTMEAQRQFGG